MSRKLLFIILLFTCAAAAVYALSGREHDFAENECAGCHFDVKNEPAGIKPAVTLACSECHSIIKQKQSHPVDIYPGLAIPEDMPLIEGRLTCITCHYVHPKKGMKFAADNHYLRRFSKGMYFCMTCHNIDKDNHIIVDNIHPGSYRVNDYRSRIDRISLACIECHDSYINAPVGFLGSGNWNHFSREFKHPIGISYEEAIANNWRKFRSAGMLSDEIKLYDGKIGCGTCHNIYSREKNMLVMDNRRSRLCLECHNK